MKKKAFFLFLSLLCSISAFSQNLQGESVIGINTGFSMAGAVLGLTGLIDDVETNTTPAWQVSYDYAIHDHISIGGAAAWQRFHLQYSNYGEEQVDFGVSLSRFNAGGRVLFHYGSNDRIDLYSGLKVGISHWSVDVGAEVEGYSPPKVSGVVPAFQLIAFGLRGYVTSQLGLNAEIALGAPHLASVGLTYRF